VARRNERNFLRTVTNGVDPLREVVSHADLLHKVKEEKQCPPEAKSKLYTK
jgi:hypothetical protein